MYSFANLELVHCFMSSSNSCFLTYIQISQEAGKVFWYSHLFKNFPQFVVIHIVKGVSVVNEAEVDVFLEFPYFFYDTADVGTLISDSSAFSKSSLNIWKFSAHILLKPSLENFEHYFASIWDECNYAVVWTFFGIALIWDLNDRWFFPVLWPLLSFPNLLAYWVQHFNNGLSLSKLQEIVKDREAWHAASCMLHGLACCMDWHAAWTGMLQSMGSQRVRHDWVAEQQQQAKGATVRPCLEKLSQPGQILWGVL